MKVYVAGPWPRRQDVAALATLLISEGWEVTYPWWENIPNPDSVDWCREVWAKEKKGVEDCDVFVLFWPREQSPGFGSGRETGLAEAAKKPIYLLGTPAGDYSLIRASYRILPDLMSLVETLKLPPPSIKRSSQELL